MTLTLTATGCSASPTPLALGVTADELSTADSVGVTLQRPVSIYQWFSAWHGEPGFDRARADAVTARGALPLLTWEPWAPDGGIVQPDYTMAGIAAGRHDAYVRAFARQVRDWNGLLGLRFAHELNAPHYPWSVGVNGNTAEHAKAAWRHVRSVFREEGADVVWVWTVNVSGPETADYAGFYPGDDDVDWVGLDGYNGGSDLPWGGWRSPEQLLGPDLKALKELSDRPLVLTEVASAPNGGDKAAWVRDLFDLAREEGLAGLVWFEHNKEADWRLAGDPAVTAAARTGAAAAEVAPQAPVPSRLEARRPTTSASP